MYLFFHQRLNLHLEEVRRLHTGRTPSLSQCVLSTFPEHMATFNPPSMSSPDVLFFQWLSHIRRPWVRGVYVGWTTFRYYVERVWIFLFMWCPVVMSSVCVVFPLCLLISVLPLPFLYDIFYCVWAPLHSWILMWGAYAKTLPERHLKLLRTMCVGSLDVDTCPPVLKSWKQPPIDTFWDTF